MKLSHVRHGAAVHLARIEDGHAALLEAESDAQRADVMIDAIETRAHRRRSSALANRCVGRMPNPVRPTMKQNSPSSSGRRRPVWWPIHSTRAAHLALGSSLPTVSGPLARRLAIWATAT